MFMNLSINIHLKKNFSMINNQNLNIQLFKNLPDKLFIKYFNIIYLF